MYDEKLLVSILVYGHPMGETMTVGQMNMTDTSYYVQDEELDRHIQGELGNKRWHQAVPLQESTNWNFKTQHTPPVRNSNVKERLDEAKQVAENIADDVIKEQLE